MVPSEQISTLTTTSSFSAPNPKFCERLNVIVSEHLESIQKIGIRRKNLNEKDFGKILHKIIQEFSPDTFQLIPQSSFDIDDNSEQQERANDLIIQELLQYNAHWIETIRNQQEIHAPITEYLISQPENVAAFIDFQRRQEQENVRVSQQNNDHRSQLISIARDQKELRQENIELRQQIANQNNQLADIRERQPERERNNEFSNTLLQHVEQLTQIIVVQQEQHARNTEALHQLIHRSLDNIQSTRVIDENLRLYDMQERARGRFHFDLQTFQNTIQTIVLSCILMVILRDA